VQQANPPDGTRGDSRTHGDDEQQGKRQSLCTSDQGPAPRPGDTPGVAECYEHFPKPPTPESEARNGHWCRSRLGGNGGKNAISEIIFDSRRRAIECFELPGERQ
jgi:hypothetical protein